MDLHTFLTILFSENIGFSGGFQKTRNVFFKYNLWTHQHFICWRFSKYLYSQGTSETKEIVFSDGLQFIYVRIEQFIFGNVMSKQCTSCKLYWLYYINAWWRMLLCLIYIQCYGIQLSHDSPRTFPPPGLGVWHVLIEVYVDIVSF